MTTVAPLPVASITPPTSITATREIYRLIVRSLATRGRIAALVLLGAVAILIGLAVGLSRPDDPAKVAHDLVDGYGLGLLAPVTALVFASAALGDLVDDKTLVYLWLTPVRRLRITLAALAAAATVAVPMAVIPVTTGAALSRVGVDMMLGAAASSALATAAYTSLFLALGLRVRRALPWGLAYVLIWEGAVARVARGAARISVDIYARSVLSTISKFPKPTYGVDLPLAVGFPIVVTVLGIVLTNRWLGRAEVD